MPDEKIDEKRPAHADSELRKMQQRLVDDTVDDSFPASDPPAWTTTGSKSVAAKLDADDAAAPVEPIPDQRQQSAGAVRRVLKQASGLAQGAYRHSGEYVEEVRHRFSDAERYSRQSAQAVARPVQQYPLLALLTAAAVGYGLAWLIHSRTAQLGATKTSRQARSPTNGDTAHDGSFGAMGPDGSGDSPKPHGDKYARVVRTIAGERGEF